MEEKTDEIEGLGVSLREKLKEKMEPIYKGLVREIVNGKWEYKIEENEMPSRDELLGYFSAKNEYLNSLIKKSAYDIGRQRELEGAEMRVRLAAETIKGKASRPELVVAEIEGLRVMCGKYINEGPNTEDTIELLSVEAQYFGKVVDKLKDEFGVRGTSGVNGAVDLEIYPVIFGGMISVKRKPGEF